MGIKEDIKRRALLNLGLDPDNIDQSGYIEEKAIKAMFLPCVKEILSTSNWFFLEKRTFSKSNSPSRDEIIISRAKEDEFFILEANFEHIPPWVLLCVELHLTLRLAAIFRIAAVKITFIEAQLKKALNEANYLNSTILHSQL